MQSSMLYNQRSKQHFMLSKLSLNKKNVKHIDPKHTHTRNSIGASLVACVGLNIKDPNYK